MGEHIFIYGRIVVEVTTFSDSDLAVCKETRRSSVILLGSHTLKAYTRKQKLEDSMVQAALSSGQVRKSARHRGSSAPGRPS